MDQTEQTGFPTQAGRPAGNGQPNPSGRQPALLIRGLSKHFGSKRILSDINLEVYPGEIFGFLGPNGSGKTTTIKLILGLLSMETGEILIDGHSVRSNFEAALARVGGIIENPEMYKYLTGYENLELYARMYTPHIPKARIDEVTRLVGLGGRIHDKVGRYSLGMRQRLGVAQALLASPRLLVLDEPTNGLDPVGIHDLRELLRHVARTEGTAVFVSSHMLAEMDLMCDRVGILENGTVVGVHSVKELHGAVSVSDRTKLQIATTMPDRAEAAMLELNGADGAQADGTPAGAAPVVTLLGRAPDSESEVAGSVLVSVSVEREKARELIRRLALSDVEFHAILPVRRSLEDAYLSMTTPLGGNHAVSGSSAPGTPEPSGNPTGTGTGTPGVRDAGGGAGTAGGQDASGRKDGEGK